MGLLQSALALSRTKVESLKDPYSTKLRENPACTCMPLFCMAINKKVKSAHFCFGFQGKPISFNLLP